MDKASAPGAGDSRLESWAGHLLAHTRKVNHATLHLEINERVRFKVRSNRNLVAEHIVAIGVTDARSPAGVYRLLVTDDKSLHLGNWLAAPLAFPSTTWLLGLVA